MMNRKIEFNDDALEHALDFIRERFRALNLTKKESSRAELMCEETLSALIEHVNRERVKFIYVNVRKFLGNISVELKVPGDEFSFSESISHDYDDEDETSSAEAIRNIILRSFSENIRYRHSGKFNTVKISIVHSKYSGLYWTLGSLILAVITGVLMKLFVPEEICRAFNDNILVSVRTVFMNGLTLCAVPVVFFSIASCVIQFAGMSDMRRAGSKVLITFVISALIASFMGIVIPFLIRPGENLSEYLSASSSVSNSSSISVRETVINIIPSNIFRPFINGDMLQIIVIAVLTGAATGMTSAKTFMSFMEEGSMIFMRIMGMFMHMMPLIVFCSIASMILTTGTSAMLSLIGILLTMMSGSILLISLQLAYVAIAGRLNPLTFIRKSVNMIITAVSTCSSTASMPASLKAADDMGISPKLSSFAIPFGLTLNKSSMCLAVTSYMTIASIVYGIHMSPYTIISAAFLNVILVTAAPAMTGSTFIILASMLAQISCPADIIGMFMSLNPILDMIDTPAACLGNLAVTLVASRNENMLDLEKFYGHE